jgi:arsenite methyltransferase
VPDGNNHIIHDIVRQHYGRIAAENDPELSLSAACCSADEPCECGPMLYDAALLEGLPVDVTGLSLGCGDPVTLAGLCPGEIVLDLGSGGGIDCFLAARQVGPAGYVIGVDMTPEMLVRANANRATLGLTNVEFRQGQIEALPVADSTIDIIMSNCVINLAPDKAAVFGEAYRVLKPGGRLAVSDIVTEGSFSPAQRAELNEWAACVTGAIDVTEYTSLMEAAGFTAIQVVDKADAEDIVPRQPGMPRVFSARIMAHKPA